MEICPDIGRLGEGRVILSAISPLQCPGFLNYYCVIRLPLKWMSLNILPVKVLGWLDQVIPFDQDCVIQHMDTVYWVIRSEDSRCLWYAAVLLSTGIL